MIIWLIFCYWYVFLFEKKIARFYQDDVCSSIICTKKKKILKLIDTFIDDSSLLKPYEEKAYLDHNRYGSKECVEIVYNQIKKEVEIKNYLDVVNMVFLGIFIFLTLIVVHFLLISIVGSFCNKNILKAI